MCASMGGRVAVLVSGSGTNLQALLDDPADPAARRAGAVRPAGGSERSSARPRPGSKTVVIEPGADRGALSAAVADALTRRGIDVIVSAGYMRVLGSPVVDRWRDRWLNVHPALLPAFPGIHAVADALAAGVKVTGVTVHLVDEGVDTGPIVLQEAIAIRPDDDWDTLEVRVHEVEHRLLPARRPGDARGPSAITVGS